jgi:hypothetical protein
MKPPRASALGDPHRWRPSTFPGGSPGQPDPLPGPPPPAVRVTEVLAASANSSDDWVEVYNPEQRAAEIGGWWLTDSFNRPKRARIPAGWTVPPQGFLVIPASVFDGAGPDGFAFSAEGDGVWLLSADAAGNFTGWMHGFTFGASPPNTSFGRWTTSTGQEHFIAQSRPSPGSLNSESPVGPLVFTEIALAPSSTGRALGVNDAFIEILNLSAQPVPLAHPFDPASAWQIQGTVDFQFAQAFPTGQILEPGARLLLVSFNPTLEPFALAAFRARYAINPDITITGPWRGELNPNQTTLRLLPPSGADRFSDAQALPVGAEVLDLVPLPPWPATGFAAGQSLSRKSSMSFAGDGAQWAATPPTPGEADIDLDGLPDSWETLHGLNPTSALGHDGLDGNPDADAFTNLEEYRGRTDPTVADTAGRLMVLPSGHGRIACLVSGRAGQPFVLEGTDANRPAQWQELRSEVIPNEGTWVFQLATGTPRAFLLRLRTP